MQNLTLKVGGIHCENCASKVKAILKGIKGVKHIEVEVIKMQRSGIVKIEFDTPASIEAIKEEILDCGYEVLE